MFNPHLSTPTEGPVTMDKQTFDIKPITPISSWERTPRFPSNIRYPLDTVATVTGLSKYFIKKATGCITDLSAEAVTFLLEQDAFGETFVPRSRILEYLDSVLKHNETPKPATSPMVFGLVQGDAKALIPRIPDHSIQCVVTSTPYWAMRVYDDMQPTVWADGEHCPFGMEQTPESFIRHSVEILHELYPKLTMSGSVWWNIMDTYNTRTQIRGNAVEVLRAMQGLDRRSWSEHSHKRYSHGHAYLKDGEQCLIPQRIAERASRIGFYVKSMISWIKSSSLPEPQHSRVSRNVEYVIHLTKTRTPFFDKESFRTLPPNLGGKQPFESNKLSDFWYLPTSTGREDHGAQFPLELPSRCIALSSKKGDVVLDPFVGSGTTAQAALALERNYIGIDTSQHYITQAKERAVPRSL